jgi:hypothetical protein
VNQSSAAIHSTNKYQNNQNWQARQQQSVGSTFASGHAAKHTGINNTKSHSRQGSGYGNNNNLKKYSSKQI